MDYQQLLVQNLELVDRLVRFVARRHHLSAMDVEEFAGLVRVKLVDHDFAVLRKFEGRSSLTTYLTIVIERVCLDYCTARWGRWRPSASARRLGPVAMLLEQLIVWEGITFDEAVGTLQTNHRVTASRAELHALLLQLPVRTTRNRIEESTEAPPVAAEEPEEASVEAAAAAERVQAALIAAVALLTPEDRLVLKLRFEDGLAVPQIAEVLGEDRRPLYRRLDRLIGRLREALHARGIDEAQMSELMQYPELTVEGVWPPSPKSPPLAEPGTSVTSRDISLAPRRPGVRPGQMPRSS